MGRVNVEFKPLHGSIANTEYQISKLRLASAYFRIQGVKSSISQIFTSLGKTFIIYNILKNDNGYFVKSDGYAETDPTEKGTYSYYLGMATCKWVSEALFHIPLLQYFSLERKSPTSSVTSTSSKCPDLVGKDKNGKFWLFEAKGTCGEFNKSQIETGKQQMPGITIFGTTPSGIVTESYFKKKIYSIYAEDPRSDDTEFLEYNDDVVIQNYYHNIVEILKFQKEELADKYVFNYITWLDESRVQLQIGLNKEIYNLFTQQDYAGIHSLVMGRYDNNIEQENEIISADGISFKIIKL